MINKTDTKYLLENINLLELIPPPNPLPSTCLNPEAKTELENTSTQLVVKYNSPNAIKPPITEGNLDAILKTLASLISEYPVLEAENLYENQ